MTLTRTGPALHGHPAASDSWPLGTGTLGPGRIAATLISAVLRAAAAAAAGLLLTGGLALLLWAVTPDSGSDATGLLRGSVVAFGAAHFLPVSIGGVPFTLRPLMLTAVAVLMIASSAGRGRAVRGRVLEGLHAFVLALTYAVSVDLAVGLLAPAGVVRLSAAPFAVASVAVLGGLCLHRTAWSRWWRRWAFGWLRVGLRAGGAAACLLAAGGAVAVAVGLLASFRDATAIAHITAGSAGDGFGLFLMCLAFLPNAVAAGVGYLTGAGFSVGGASFSPLVVHPAELPAIPLLAAAPDGAVASRAALLAFVVPLLAGLLIAMVANRRLGARRDRMAAAGVAAAVAGLLVAGLAAAARGGVAGGPWASTGAPVLLAGGLAVAALVVVSVTWCAVAGLGSVPWTLWSGREREADPESGSVGDEDVVTQPAGSGSRTPTSRPRGSTSPGEDQVPEISPICPVGRQVDPRDCNGSDGGAGTDRDGSDGGAGTDIDDSPAGTVTDRDGSDGGAGAVTDADGSDDDAVTDADDSPDGAVTDEQFADADAPADQVDADEAFPESARPAGESSGEQQDEGRAAAG